MCHTLMRFADYEHNTRTHAQHTHTDTIRLQVITSFVSIIGSFRFSSALMNFVNRLHICSTIGYVNFVCYSAKRQMPKKREKN